MLLGGREEGPRVARVAEAAAHEHLRHRAAHAELALQALDILGDAVSYLKLSDFPHCPPHYGPD